MEISDRLVQVKTFAKVEEDFLTYTPNEFVFLFGDVIRPVDLILNHDDPSECFVLFLTAAPMQEIYSLSEDPSWVGAHMHLTIKKPHPDIFLIVIKLLTDKALEEGEEYEYIPIEPLDPRGAGGPGKHSTPKRGKEPVATAFTKQLKSLETQKLQQIMSVFQQEMKSRQEAYVGPGHDVSLILQTLLNEGALMTNIPKNQLLVGKGPKGRYHLNSRVISTKASGSIKSISRKTRKKLPLFMVM